MVQPVADLLIDTYEESVSQFTSLANYLYSHWGDEVVTFTLEDTIKVTQHGEANAACIGPDSLMLYWYKCEREIHNNVSAWN